MGEFDFNTLRVDRKISESEKNELRFQKYPEACLRGLNLASYKIHPSNQSAIKASARGRCKTRENVYLSELQLVFGLSCDWLRIWRENFKIND